MTSQFSQLLKDIQTLSQVNKQLNDKLETLYKSQKADRVLNGYDKWRIQPDGGRKLVREQLVKLDYKCSVCAEELSETSATIDHLLPKVKYLGLAMRSDNMLVMCHSCNSCKGTKKFREWYDSLHNSWQERLKQAIVKIHGNSKFIQLLNTVEQKLI